MGSTLIIAPVDRIQGEILTSIARFPHTPGLYVSLNKTAESMEAALLKQEVDVSRLFFIDCITAEQKRKDILHIQPTELFKLASAISIFVEEMPEKGRFVFIDALSTFLIYNDENKVAQFVKNVIERAAEKDIEVVALSPETKGEELLNKIYNFFDEVRNTGK